MKVVIVNCFDTYQSRVELLYNYFSKNGYKVTVLTSDFRHIKKMYITERKNDYEYVAVKSYYKNISIKRIMSHYKFAKDAIRQVEKSDPDLLWVLLPPNSLGVQAQKYKAKVQSVKVVFDFIDIWPETMPIKKFEKSFFYQSWKSMRERSINCADAVVTECDYFHRALNDYYQKNRMYTIYLAREIEQYVPKAKLKDDIVEICYLGSINNIVDIPMIVAILRRIQYRIVFHVIGNGEKKEELVNEISKIDVSVIDHGELYDKIEKRKIFERCHFGMNIMKESVFVGLTMKSIDYLENGLPMINNIPGDTKEMVEKFGIGINVDNVGLVKETIELDRKFFEIEIRVKTRKVFEKMFSIENSDKKLDELINELGLDEGVK